MKQWLPVKIEDPPPIEEILVVKVKDTNIYAAMDAQFVNRPKNIPAMSNYKVREEEKVILKKYKDTGSYYWDVVGDKKGEPHRFALYFNQVSHWQIEMTEKINRFELMDME